MRIGSHRSITLGTSTVVVVPLQVQVRLTVPVRTGTCTSTVYYSYCTSCYVPVCLQIQSLPTNLQILVPTAQSPQPTFRTVLVPYSYRYSYGTSTSTV